MAEEVCITQDKLSEDDRYSRYDSIANKEYKLVISEENPKVVGYPADRFDLSRDEQQVLTYIQPVFGLNEIYWQPTKNLSAEEVVKIIIDLLPLAKEELYESYDLEKYPELINTLMFVKYFNTQNKFKEVKFDRMSKECIDSVVEYDDIESLSIGVNVGTEDIHMALSSYKRSWNAEQGRLSMYFDKMGRKTFDKFYAATTNYLLTTVFSNLGISLGKETLNLKENNKN